MRKLSSLITVIALIALCSPQSQAQNSSSPPATLGYDTHLTLAPSNNGIWADGVGNGFVKGARELEGTVGAGIGVRFGGGANHNLALSELRFGWVFSRVLGEGCWYSGNFELLGELMAGAQFHPNVRYVVGLEPILRYNFVTHTRWVPFVDAGAGVVATSIYHPDLGEVFNFNLQGGPGFKYYFRDNLAFIAQYRYLHISDAGLSSHNKGVNVNMFLLGVSWGF